MKARIDKTQQISKYRLCGDRDETIHKVISECSKLVLNEYKTRHDGVGTVIYCVMCKKFKCDHKNKCYMHNHTTVDWCFWYSHQRTINETGGFGHWRTTGDHPNYSIIYNGQNTEKSPGDF